MPVYNCSDDYLKQSINSVLNQSYKSFEFIIVDDASIDSVRSTIDSFNDKRIHHIKVDINRGEYWTTNYAITFAHDRYLTWVHADDKLPVNSLELRLNILENSPTLDFVHGDIETIDESGKTIERKNATDMNSKEIMDKFLSAFQQGRMDSSLIHHTTIMMRREFFDKAGPFDESLPYAGDIDWVIRAVKIGKLIRIPEILYYYRNHPNTQRSLAKSRNINIEKIHKDIAAKYIS